MDPNGSWVFFPFLLTLQMFVGLSHHVTPGSLCFHWALGRDDVSHETSLLHAVMILHTWILQWSYVSYVQTDLASHGAHPRVTCLVKWKNTMMIKKNFDLNPQMTIIVESDNDITQIWTHFFCIHRSCAVLFRPAATPHSRPRWRDELPWCFQPSGAYIYIYYII